MGGRAAWKFNLTGWRLVLLLLWFWDVPAYTTTKDNLITTTTTTTTAFADLKRVRLRAPASFGWSSKSNKENHFKYVYSSTSVGFPGPHGRQSTRISSCLAPSGQRLDPIVSDSLLTNQLRLNLRTPFTATVKSKRFSYELNFSPLPDVFIFVFPVPATFPLPAPTSVSCCTVPTRLRLFTGSNKHSIGEGFSSEGIRAHWDKEICIDNTEINKTES